MWLLTSGLQILFNLEHPNPLNLTECLLRLEKLEMLEKLENEPYGKAGKA